MVVPGARGMCAMTEMRVCRLSCGRISMHETCIGSRSPKTFAGSERQKGEFEVWDLWQKWLEYGG